MGVTIDKLLDKPLLHSHKDEDISDFSVLDGRYVNSVGDTLTITQGHTNIFGVKQV